VSTQTCLGITGLQQRLYMCCVRPHIWNLLCFFILIFLTSLSAEFLYSECRHQILSCGGFLCTLSLIYFLIVICGFSCLHVFLPELYILCRWRQCGCSLVRNKTLVLKVIIIQCKKHRVYII
jgi:hypothetical protein